MAYDTPLSRRALLAVSAAAAATTAAPIAALAASNPDTELLRLDREHDEVYARSLRIGSGSDGLDDDDIEAVCEAMYDVEHAIHCVPAQALAGLAVKARVASVYFEPVPAAPLMMGIFTSLVEDILRIADVTPKPPICGPLHAEKV